MKVQSFQPIIGISGNLSLIESGSYAGRERTFIVHDYVLAVEEAGGIPVVLPVVQSEKCVKQQLASVDGLLLSGGCDVHPLNYGEEPQRGLGHVNVRRDAYEFSLIRYAEELGKPIFGVCRGLQILNVIFGGSLIQDIPLAVPAALQHDQKSRPEDGSHRVELVEGTLLQRVIGEELIVTNSYHHQAVKELAPGFVVNAWSKDGIIEGIERNDHEFLLGVQWHPELMHASNPHMRKLFHAFVEVAKKGRGG